MYERLSEELQAWIEGQHSLGPFSDSARDENGNPLVAFSLGWFGDLKKDLMLDMCKQEHEKYLGQLPNRDGKLHWRVKPEISPDVDFSDEKKTKIYWRLSVSQMGKWLNFPMKPQKRPPAQSYKPTPKRDTGRKR